MRFKSKRMVGIAAAAGLLIAGAVIWMFFFKPDRQPDLITQSVMRASIEKTVLASGTLEPFEQVSVGAQVSGQVTRLAVALGDQVRAGDLIAEIDAQKQQNDLSTTQAQLNNQRAQRATASANLALAESTFARQRMLYEADAVSRAEFEAAQAGLKSARASVDAINAQMAQAAISVRTAGVNLGYTRILAPIDGTVIAVVTKQGQTVNANQSAPTIVTLGRLDKMTVKAEISEADVIKVRTGMTVYFTTLGDPDKRYYARLRSIEPAPVNFSGEATASGAASAIYYYGLFDVDNLDGVLRPAMTAQVAIVQAGVKNVLVVPVAALGAKGRDGTYRVMVVAAKGQAPEPRRVRIGINDGTQAQVLKGLHAGEQVVVARASPDSTASGGRRDGGRGGQGGRNRVPGMRGPAPGGL